MQLFRRLPTLRWRAKKDEHLVPPAVRANYPSLADDFFLLEQELVPHFRTLDNEALRAQNRFRLEQVVIIFGGALATALGAVQVALINTVWSGIVEAVLTIILAAIAQRARAWNAQNRYFTNRLAAETLRSVYFKFLGRLGPYANENSRVPNLIRHVAEVRAKAREEVYERA